MLIEGQPKVSIGLAVYNGENYLEAAIESLLNQTYKNFELIISDNASTDRTQEICQNYLSQDPRIRYYRNQKNIGGANNENQTFRYSRGEYFKLAAHDDLCAPEFIEKCLKILENNPSVVLCYSQIVNINAKGETLGVISRKFGETGSIYKNFYDISYRQHPCEPIYGVIRSEVLRKTRLQQNYTDSDRTLLCELVLHGKFYEVPEPLFYKRYHEGNTYLDWRTRMAWFNEANIGKIVFPNWMQFFDFYTTVFRTPLRRKEKFILTLLISGPILFRHIKSLVKDLMIMIQMLMHSKQWREKKYLETTNW